MAHFRKNVYQHLSSAKKWLTRAEEAFDKERDIRGELDLMLAQAELQHVKEVSRSKHWRHKYTVVRHGVALTCAVVMAAGLGGVYWWTSKPDHVVPVPLVKKVSAPVESQIQSSSNGGQLPAVSVETKKVVVIDAAPPVQRVAAPTSMSQEKRTETSQQVEPAAAISPDEMQKLVRAAGKTLRGQ
ncbi:hypothetical protein [Pelosinus propionicus]|uniref:Uncharacterized protein n=1 Tax=Pelosinus propionicus DSM 13327 TaxID=1123291 RepID=A0A1I4J7M7_9FIRM|nr:hypothetical protein [Pelosinus propionicus]SFL62183.1 hypothetical protein SAMN04490355_101135 [Pelosinus propionicus DSM 13327]